MVSRLNQAQGHTLFSRLLGNRAKLAAGVACSRLVVLHVLRMHSPTTVVLAASPDAAGRAGSRLLAHVYVNRYMNNGEAEDAAHDSMNRL